MCHLRSSQFLHLSFNYRDLINLISPRDLIVSSSKSDGPPAIQAAIRRSGFSGKLPRNAGRGRRTWMFVFAPWVHFTSPPPRSLPGSIFSVLITGASLRGGGFKDGG